MKQFLIAFCLLASTLFVYAQQETIALPAPTKTGGKPLMETLSSRQSIRTYTGEEINLQNLSDLLWAANGFNRADKRTVPTSQNRQELEVYVMLKDAVYTYDAKENKLTLKASGDLRGNLGEQPYVMDAAVNLIVIANLDKASNRDVALIDTGYISQNVYLYCTSAGLGTVARKWYDSAKLAAALKLTDKQEVTLVQTVGVPK